jgi:hypothetical protein
MLLDTLTTRAPGVAGSRGTPPISLRDSVSRAPERD